MALKLLGFPSRSRYGRAGLYLGNLATKDEWESSWPFIGARLAWRLAWRMAQLALLVMLLKFCAGFVAKNARPSGSSPPFGSSGR